MALEARVLPQLETRSTRVQSAVVLACLPVFVLAIGLGLVGLVTGLFSAWIAFKGIMVAGSATVGTMVYLRWKITRAMEVGRAIPARILRRARTPVDWDRLLGSFAKTDNVKGLVQFLPVETVSYTYEDQGRTHRGMFFLLGGESPDSEDPESLTLLVDPEYSWVRSVLIRAA
jgi:hypothetical protein